MKFKDKIQIHVIDDTKNEKRNFTFSRGLLIKYMKYFDKCLKKISENDEIDISIHCDATIFEWLLKYILAQEELAESAPNSDQTGNNGWYLRVQKCSDSPQLDNNNVVTILISADFLKIDDLVKECLTHFVANIQDIAKQTCDMGCINSQIIREIAKNVHLDILDQLKERKDKLVSRLFMKKLELLLEKDKNYLLKCAYCNELFTKDQRKYLKCYKGRQIIDAHGQMLANHVQDKEWDLKKFVTFIRETYRISWKEIYWKVWAHLNMMSCGRCGDYFALPELYNC